MVSRCSIRPVIYINKGTQCYNVLLVSERIAESYT